MKVHQAVLKIAKIVQRLRFLINPLYKILINRERGFGVFQPVFRLGQQDVASAAGNQAMLFSGIQLQSLKQKAKSACHLNKVTSVCAQYQEVAYACPVVVDIPVLSGHKHQKFFGLYLSVGNRVSEV